MNRSGALLLLAAIYIAGCAHPLQRSFDQTLREQLANTTREYRKALESEITITTTRPISDVEAKMSAQRLAEIDRMSGPTAYEDTALDLGADLYGMRGDQAAPTVAMTLRRALHGAAANNLDILIAQLEPAVSAAVFDQAVAAFDPTVFASLSLAKVDTPRPTSTVDDVFGPQQNDTLTFIAGIRKLLETGAQFTIQTEVTRNDASPSFFDTTPYHNANLAFEIIQPLLRGFGSDITRARIMLARSATAQRVASLKQEQLDVAVVTEQAYWALYFSRQRVLIQKRLLERTRLTRDRIVIRAAFDATPAEVTQARSSFESQRAQLIRTRQDVRRASDALKQLFNSPNLSVAGETLVRPLDTPVDRPMQLSLLDAVNAALANRPELQEAMAAIQDASIRQRVADNGRLPDLTVTATVQYNGVGADAGEGYEQVNDGNYIDYRIQIQFELPLGNRQRQAAFRQRQFERLASVINYRRQVQDIVVEVRNAMRDVVLNYELIGAEQAARRAAADQLRDLQVLEEHGAGLTPQFLDLKLRRDEALAAAELRELRALIDYNNAVANFYRTIGTLLDRNGIDFDTQP